MNISVNEIESSVFDFIDQFKILLSQDTWENILLNCTKNELLVLLLLYRQTDVNMTQIALYLDAPVNTVTGIVSRMEKKKIVQRLRKEEDKRVVTIVLTEIGAKQIADIIRIFLGYAQKMLLTLTEEEFKLLSKVMGNVVNIIKETPTEKVTLTKKIRKIEIN